VGCVAALLAHPDRIELLLARPELVPSAVEEILRWTSPAGSFAHGERGSRVRCYPHCDG